MLIHLPEEQELYRAPRYSLTVNTTNRTVSLYKDGKYVKYYPIAIGKPTDPIPTTKLLVIRNKNKMIHCPIRAMYHLFLMIENIIFDNKLSISLKNVIKQYYLSLPLISTHKAKIIAESLAYNALNIEFVQSHSVVIGNKKYSFHIESPISRDFIKQNTEQSLDMIEKIYKNENVLLHAIEMGDIEKLGETFGESSLISRYLEDRVPNDPLRAGKNLAFVFNTLLRKAAEKGGLHPVDIHSISEKYAVQIEQTTTTHHLTELISKMPLDYCKAVKKLSLKNFNYLTQKAIEYIRKNIDSELSLEAISKAIDVNPYVLCRQFKKETKQNITEYINIQRINEAVYIMENKNISITDIAYMVGFNDINYFSKVFKKLKGMTPSKYRKDKY